MKTTIVPAQVTSHEDTISGSLTLTQIILLILPVFISAGLFALLPPTMHLKPYKIIVLIFFCLPPLVLAIRIKDELIVDWLLIILRYVFRPRNYLLSVHNECDCSCLYKTLAASEIKTTNSQLNLDNKQLYKELSPSELLLISKKLGGKRVEYFTDNEGILNAVIK